MATDSIHKGTDAVLAGLVLSKARLKRRRTSLRDRLSDTNSQTQLLDKDDTIQSVTMVSGEDNSQENTDSHTTAPISSIPPIFSTNATPSSVTNTSITVTSIEHTVPLKTDTQFLSEEGQRSVIPPLNTSELQSIPQPQKEEVLEDQANNESLPQQSEPSPMVAIAIEVIRGFPLKAKLALLNTAVRLTFINETTGLPVEKSSLEHCAVSYYERDNPVISYILPVMTQPSKLVSDKQAQLTAIWKEEVIFCEQRSCLLDNEDVILFLELLDLPHQAPPSPLAWGILQINKVPHDKEFGVKMYHMPQWWKHRRKNAGDLLSLKRPQSYPTVLYLKLQLKDPSDLSTEAQVRSYTPTAQEKSDDSKLQKSKLASSSVHSMSAQPIISPQWSRLPGQPCGIPDKLTTTLSTGVGGCSALSFSPSGRLLAVGCDSGRGFIVKIYHVPGWLLACSLPCDDSLIYQLSWTSDEKYLAVSSASGLCHVWMLVGEITEYLCPHPSYVYCVQWIESEDAKMLFTGCYDGAIRCWTENQLVQVAMVTKSRINTLCYDAKNSILFSGNSEGSIMLWDVNTDAPSINHFKTLSLSQFNGCNIQQLHLLPWQQRLVVHVAKKPLTIVDLRMENVVMTLSSKMSSSYSSICVSPCGGLVIGISSPLLSVWSTADGQLLREYECIQLHCPALACEYHPCDHMLVCGGLGSSQNVFLFEQ